MSVTEESEGYTKPILVARQESLFSKLTKINDEFLAKVTTSRMAVIERQLPRLEKTLDTLEQDILEYNISANKKDQIKFRVDSFQVIIDRIAGECLKLNKAPIVNNLDRRVRKLPPVNLPTFNGCISDWQSFSNLFRTLVHDNVDLSDIEKFQYLKTHLEKEPAALVSNYPLEGTKYQEAYDALIARYDNTRRLASFFVRQILRFKGKPKDIHQFLEYHRASTASLKTLPLADLSDFLLFQLVYENVDTEVQRAFDLQLDDNDNPTLEQLYTFLQVRARSDELHVDAMTTKTTQPKFKALLAQPEPQPQLQHSEPLYQPMMPPFYNSLQNMFQPCPPVYPHLAHAYQPQQLNPTAAPPLALHAYQPQPPAYPVNPQFNQRDSPTFQPTCPYCKGPHQVYACESFANLPAPERCEFAKRLRLCFNCLSDRHVILKCGSSRRCRQCNKPHHSLLHLETAPVPEEKRNAVLNLQEPSSDLLGTLMCEIEDAFGMRHKARCILDCGSQITACSLRFIQRLGLKLSKREKEYSITGVSENPVKTCGTVDLMIRSLHDRSISYSCSAFVLKTISNDVPADDLPSTLVNKILEQHLPLADPHFHLSEPIDILLGVGAYMHMMSSDADHLRRGTPSLLKTNFGWVVLGTVHLTRQQPNTVLTLQNETASALTKFWEMEEIPSAPARNPADAYCEEHFLATHTRDDHGRYSVSIPPRSDVPPLASNYEAAERSFKYLESKFSRNPELASAYRSRMNEFIKEGHLKRAPSNVSYLLPHHCVTKMDSSTSAYRVVFNASSNDISGFSLNDRIHVGPRLQKNICQILLNFSKHVVALTCDMKAMYCQVLLNEDSRPYHQLLWRENPNDAVHQYQMQRLVFGVSTSAFLAQRVVHQLVIDEGPRFPRAAIVLDNDCYVDNIVTGAESVEAAIELQTELIELCLAGGFPLRKWASSHADTLKQLDKDLLETPLTFETDSPSIKLLGLYWEPASDCFRYQAIPFAGPLTKRNVLRYIASTFDPMSWIGPVTTWMKCYMQKLWIDKVDWDAAINDPLVEEWNQFMSSFPSLSLIRIPRHVKMTTNTILLGFSDASQLAFGAVIYSFNSKSNETRLLLSKSKVAPLRTQSIPRLELCAALLLATLTSSVVAMLGPDQFDSIYLYSDSSTVLAWLRKSPHSLPTFEANRVAKIQNLNVGTWGHVKSEDNPADCLSRGLTPTQLIDHPLWWQVPVDALELPPSLTVNLVQEDRTVPTILSVQNVTPDPGELSSVLARYSSFSKMLRLLALLRRFIYNTRQRDPKLRKFFAVTAAEMQACVIDAVRISQHEDFAKDIENVMKNREPSKTLQSLSPSMDTRGLLTVGGRLAKSNLPIRSQHPWILSKTSWLSRMICDHYHQSLLHSGPLTTQSMIRRKFWILSLRDLLRKRIRQCSRCHRFSGKPFQPPMANLPECRVQPSRPFSAVCVDFAGPISTKESSRRTKCILKSYICVFVCTSTKAIHLEYVSSLTTDAFLAAFTRFVSRRGLPSRVISDCGTNFVGADRQLREYAQFLKENADMIMTAASSLSIEWHFNPAYAPHFGGLHEAGVRSCKKLLLRQVGDTVLTIEEFATLLCRIEAVLNSRPLIEPSSSIV